MEGKKGESQAVALNAQLLEKIKGLLTSSEPEKWQLAGRELTQDTRVARPQTVYERVLIREIPNGSLVLHSSQPVQSQYLSGGYALLPSGPEVFSIEIRDRIFDAEKVVDPRFSANQKGKRCDVLASGDVAKAIFLEVYKTVSTFGHDRKKQFELRARNMVDHLERAITDADIKDWVKTKEALGEEEIMRFTGNVDGLKVELCRSVRDWEPTFSAKFTSDRFVHEVPNSGLAKTCFKLLEEKEQNAQLEKLGNMLVDLGFKEK